MLQVQGKMDLVNNYLEQGMVDLVNNYLEELLLQAKTKENCSTQWMKQLRKLSQF